MKIARGEMYVNWLTGDRVIVTEVNDKYVDYRKEKPVHVEGYDVYTFTKPLYVFKQLYVPTIIIDADKRKKVA